LLGDQAVAETLAHALSVETWEDRATHGFHAYPAGLNPDTARILVDAFPGDSVLAPFCGGGTLLVEARIAGRATFGCDVSPTALRVARARTSTASEEVLTKVRSTARRLAEVARKAEDLPEDILQAVEEWYAPHVLCELEAIRRGLREADPEARPLLDAIFSSILVKVSWRKSDTSAQRERHHRPAGTAAILFHKKARELGRRIAALRELVPEGTPDTEIIGQDARIGYRGQKVDLVLTSPPYPGTYDYVPMQHFRRIWLDDGRAGENNELGPRRAWREQSRRARREWQEDTVKWMGASTKALRPGGHLVVVIGDGITPAGTIDTSEPTGQAAKKAGLTSVARTSVERVDHARNTSRWEHIMAYQKVR